LSEIGGKQFSDFKPMLVERAVEVLSPISSEMSRIMQDIPQLDRVLEDGACKAKLIAEPILQKTYDIIGMK
jgi:tryptophanyl-tRNA synthetase